MWLCWPLGTCWAPKPADSAMSRSSAPKAVTANPATKSVIDAGRRKIAERVSPTRDGGTTEIEIDAGTTVLRPEVRNPQT